MLSRPLDTPLGCSISMRTEPGTRVSLQVLAKGDVARTTTSAPITAGTPPRTCAARAMSASLWSQRDRTTEPTSARPCNVRSW